jgi:hypothetical protein
VERSFSKGGKGVNKKDVLVHYGAHFVAPDLEPDLDSYWECGSGPRNKENFLTIINK